MATAIAQAASDPSRSPQERALATSAARQVSFNALAALSLENTFVLAAASPDVTMDSVFTPLLIRGLEGEADFNRSGQVTIKELDYFLEERIIVVTQDRQHPISIMPRNTNSPTFGPDLSGITGLVIANGNYNPVSFRPLPSVIEDGHRFAKYLTESGGKISTIFNGSSKDIRHGLLEMDWGNGSSSGFNILYYSGHSVIDDKGAGWACVGGGVVYVEEILRLLPRDIRSLVIFLDTSFDLAPSPPIK